MPKFDVLASDAEATAFTVGKTGLVVAVEELHRLAGRLLTEPEPDPLWPDRMRALAQRLGDLQARAPDALLYLLFYGASRIVDRYSSHHALVCAAVARECAVQLQWPEKETSSLVLAALSMNISITGLQDELVYRERTLTLEQRIAVEQRAERSVALLSSLGVTDDLWLGVVAQHALPEAQCPDAPSTAQRLGHLLRRINVMTAKMSPRKARKGLPPSLAVRDAYLGPTGTPDELGVAVTKAIGIYPPGSFVSLVSGEMAIVLRRGARASQPVVASLMGSNRRILSMPVVRDTAGSLHHVKGVPRTGVSGMRLDHERLLSLAVASQGVQAAP